MYKLQSRDFYQAAFDSFLADTDAVVNAIENTTYGDQHLTEVELHTNGTFKVCGAVPNAYRLGSPNSLFIAIPWLAPSEIDAENGHDLTRVITLLVQSFHDQTFPTPANLAGLESTLITINSLYEFVHGVKPRKYTYAIDWAENEGLLIGTESVRLYAYAQYLINLALSGN